MSTVPAVERVLAEVEDPDDALRGVVAALVDAGCAWAGILFREDEGLVLGPSAGNEQPDARTRTPVVYQGAEVAELVVDRPTDQAELERVASLIALHCLVGWDTDGVAWDDIS
ncbi:MAG: hypothetical protein JO017_09695 [Actinobacteria bacterium]|nr:hypothetical protein [Actinomycetota bacterium]